MYISDKYRWLDECGLTTNIDWYSLVFILQLLSYSLIAGRLKGAIGSWVVVFGTELYYYEAPKGERKGGMVMSTKSNMSSITLNFQ